MPWRPAHETHAIERVNITIQFAEKLPSRIWQPALEDATERFRTEAITIVPAAQGLPMIGPGMIPSLNAQTLDRAFLLLDGVQPREEAFIFQQQIVFGVNRYNGWAALCAKINNIMGPLLNVGLQTSPPQLLKIEYWDRFTFDGRPEDADYNQLIRSNSTHIPKFVFQSNRIFHSHSGYFTEEEAPILLNINIDVGDVPLQMQANSEFVTKRSVGIYTMAQEAFDQKTDDHLDLAAVMSKLDDMHTTLKELLGDVITDETVSRISLFQGKQP